VLRMGLDRVPPARSLPPSLFEFLPLSLSYDPRSLDLDVEQDYFGLRLSRKDEANTGEQAVWLDLNRTLGDQTSASLL
jgi:hypothetical protein